MPDSQFFGTALAQAVSAGQVPVDRINDMATRILYAMYAVGIMDYTGPKGNLSVNATSAQHEELARYFSAASHVLLKNEGNILPLPTSGKTFAVLGDDGQAKTIVNGGGSGYVVSQYVITPLQGIKNRLGSSAKVAYAPTQPIATAAQVAAAADVAIVCVGFESSEGSDRSSLSLPNNQDQLIEAVAAAQPNTIVVLHGPGPVLMPWASKVKGIVFAWFPGQESGNALAAVLFNDINPSARLPVTFPVNENDWFSGDASQYPGVNGQVFYTEKLLVGHRWYDEHNITPLFPFGHGLSYTSFNYTDLKISAPQGNNVIVTVSVTNTGKITGTEVVQLYLGYPKAAGEPPKVLRGFEKLTLPSGQTEQAVFGLAAEDVSIWDITKKAFTPVTGIFTVYVGASSRDIRLTGTFTL